MAEEIGWGIAGPGRIAGAIAADLALVPGARLAAIGSRSPERAEAFAARHGAARAHGSYAALVADPDVDVVYIATPHPQHLAIARAAVRAGKAVLVEKAFTATLAGTEALVAEARHQGAFAMEAMWTRFHPAMVRLRGLLAEGAIGEVRSVQADLGIAPAYDPADRLWAADLGGGALLDLGVYVVGMAQMVLGAPDEVIARGSRAPTGVDAEAALLLGWSDGRTASLTVSLRTATPGAARVVGTDGWIEVHPRFHHPQALTVHRPGAEPEVLALPATGIGFTHELVEVQGCLAAGRTESAIMSLDDTVAVMRVLSAAADQLGVAHAEDETVLDGSPGPRA